MEGVSVMHEWVVLENQGQRIFGIYHHPQNATETTAPGVLIVHGFGGNKCGKHRIYVSIAQCLAMSGCAVLRFDMRGSGDSDGLFEESTLEGQISDTIVATEFLAGRPEVDTSRLGILGRSLGGAVAVSAAAQTEQFKSMVLWAPVFSADQWRREWEAHLVDAMPANLHQDVVWFEGEATSIVFVQQLFGMNLGNDMRRLENVPLLHFHGAHDKTVLLEHAKNFEKVREGSTTQTTFVKLPNSDHDFTDAEDQTRLLKESCQWFRETL